MLVIDLLEVIQIDHKDGKIKFMTFGSFYFLVQELHEEISIMDAGQIVGD